MSVDPLAFASVYLDCFLWHISGSLCAYLFFRSAFSARHAPVLLWVYFLARVSLVSSWDTFAWFGLDPEPFGGYRQAAIAMLLILMVIVLYQAWRGTVAQVTLAGLLADTLGVLAGAAAMFSVNAARGMGPALEYIGPFGPAIVAISTLYVGIFLVLRKAASPLCRRLLDSVGSHDAIATPAAIVLVSVFAAYQAMGVEGNFEANISAAYGISLVYVPLLGVLLGIDLWRSRRVHAQLVRRRRLMSAYGDALRAQSAALADSRELLDSLAARIERLEAGDADDADDGIRRHLERLRSSCDQLRFGTYSDKPVLDAVLVYYGDRLREQGVSTAFSISPLSVRGDDVAFAAQLLLEWAYAQLVRGGRPGAPDAGAAERSLVLRAFRRANRILVEVRISPMPGAQGFRLRFARRLPASCRVVEDARIGGVRVVRLLAEGDAL